MQCIESPDLLLGLCVASPAPGIPDRQSIKHKAHNNQEIVIRALIEHANQVKQDNDDRCNDIDPAHYRIRNDQGQDYHQDWD